MKNPVKRENLFLIELVGCLFLFALCAAVCTALLVNARSMSRESAGLTDAVYIAQTGAESFRASGSLDDLARSLGGAWEDGVLEVPFGPGGAPGGEGPYLLTVTPGPEDGPVATADFAVSLDGEVLYTLEGVAAPWR